MTKERILNQKEIDSLLGFDRPSKRKRVTWDYALMDLLREARGMDNFVGLFDDMLIRKIEIESRLKNGEDIDLEEPFSD